jgi:hypothetical protein
MAARFKKNKPMGGQRAPIIPEVQPAYAESQIGIRNQSPMVENYGGGVNGFLNKQFSKLDKPSAALWNVLSALGGMAKDDFNTLKNDPLGATGATLDSMIIGQEARDRFKQGDYAGAINYSGIGQFAALPEMQNVVDGKAGPMDALWLALSYGTGGIGKAAKAVTTPAKQAVKKGTTKAYIDILNRLK